MGDVDIRVTGLNELLKELRGPAFKDVNRELRAKAKEIAAGIMPHAQTALRHSAAPQAEAVAASARVHSDRLPVFAFGKVNPKFKTGFGHKGETAAQRKRRRGSITHGAVYGPLGGHRNGKGHTNFYGIARTSSGGPLGRSLHDQGDVYKDARDRYLRAYLQVLHSHGFTTRMVG